MGDYGVKSVELATRMHVAPTDVDTVIPGIGKHCRERVRLMPFSCGITDQAAVVAALTAVEAPPRAGSRGNLGIGVGKEGAMLHKRVHVWCFNHRVSGDAQMIAAMLVGGKQYDVWTLISHASQLPSFDELSVA